MLTANSTESIQFVHNNSYKQLEFPLYAWIIQQDHLLLPYERSEDSTDESIDIRIKRKLHMLGHTFTGFILKSISL